MRCDAACWRCLAMLAGVAAGCGADLFHDTDWSSACDGRACVGAAGGGGGSGGAGGIGSTASSASAVSASSSQSTTSSTTGTGGADPNVGCADGEREGFESEASDSSVAACAG